MTNSMTVRYDEGMLDAAAVCGAVEKRRLSRPAPGRQIRRRTRLSLRRSGG